MKRVYEYTREYNGELKSEIVILSFNDMCGILKCDFDEILHKVGLKLLMSPQAQKLQYDILGLPFWFLMANLTPELLKPYDVTMERLQGNVTRIGDMDRVIGKNEIQLVQSVLYEQLFIMKERSQIVARRLADEKLKGHLAISTWPSDYIAHMSAEWGYMYMGGYEDFETFFNRMLLEAKPYGDTVDTAHVVPVERKTERIIL